jgi:hypothetical protein
MTVIRTVSTVIVPCGIPNLVPLSEATVQYCTTLKHIPKILKGLYA